MKPRSLHARFVQIVALTTLALAAVAALVVYQLAQSHTRRSGVELVEGLANAIHKTVAVGAYAGDAVLLKELADGLMRHPLVLRVQILQASGDTALDTRRPSPDGSASAAAALGPAEVGLRLVSPFDAKESIGSLQVWVNQPRLAQDAQRQALTLVFAMVLLLVGVLTVFNIVALRLLSRPMHRLAEELGRIAPGTDARLAHDPEHADDEIGTVVRAANGLLQTQQAAMERERAMRAEVEAMEAQYRQIFDATSAGIFVLNPEGQLINSNPAVARVIGADIDHMQRLRSTNFVQMVFCDPQRMREMAEFARSSGQTASADLELRRLDGSTRWVHCLISVQGQAEAEQAHFVEGVLYDVTQRRTAESQAMHRAQHDALTGLKNRAYVEATLTQRVEAARAGGSRLTVLYLDLDGFKAVNDSLGHEAGDRVLIECANRLRSLVRRQTDIVGRLGGDELVVVLDGVDAADTAAQDLASQIVRSIHRPIEMPQGLKVQVGASVGMASFPSHARDAAGLLRAADAAMYGAKRGGKGHYLVAHTPVVEPA